jgi:hypothetical protein
MLVVSVPGLVLDDDVIVALVPPSADVGATVVGLVGEPSSASDAVVDEPSGPIDTTGPQPATATITPSARTHPTHRA